MRRRNKYCKNCKSTQKEKLVLLGSEISEVIKDFKDGITKNDEIWECERCGEQRVYNGTRNCSK